MNQTELSKKILAIAESAGLSPEEVQELLNGGEAVPEALQEVLGRLGDAVSDECCND